MHGQELTEQIGALGMLPHAVNRLYTEYNKR